MLRSILITSLIVVSTLCADVIEIHQELRKSFKIDKHYSKAIVLEGFPIIASEKVPDAALLEAAHIVKKMLENRRDILSKLAENKIRLGIMAVSERTCDLPEHSDLTPPAYWNKRARGLGATKLRPCVSCAEENLLHNSGDPYSTESITVHEFAHAIHQMGVNYLDPTFDQRLAKIYDSAISIGLWKNKYAAENRFEYWAEAVQPWFGTNRQNDASHNHVNTRDELIAYDPDIASLCQEIFGDNDWQYVRSDDPSRKNEAHLKDLDRSKLASFAWTKKEIKAYKKLK